LIACVLSVLAWPPPATACTNILVTKEASADGSVIITYACDGRFHPHLRQRPASDHEPGAPLEIKNWSGDVRGVIPQIEHTYAVVGLMNEHQLAISETTTTGREELENPDGLLHYWDLMQLALQRAKTAREAIGVITGLVGGGLVAFHAAFAPCSALGILALVALLITVLTGIVGRYIYVHVPRSFEGRELDLEQVREQLECCRERLGQAGVEARWLHAADTPEIRHQRIGLTRSFASLIIGDRQRRRDYRELRRAVLSSSELKPMARQILPVARNFCRHWQWMVRYHEWRDLLASWRFLHRWLAIVMLIVASFHIFLAFRYADLSVLGGLR